MAIYWSPFHHIIGPSYAPHAPTLRTGFWRKIDNTLRVLWGSMNDSDNDITFGVMDYLTLGTGVFCHYVTYYLKKWMSEDKIPTIFKPITALLWLGFKIAQFAIGVVTFLISAAIAAVATVLILPIVHFISLKLSVLDREQALQVTNLEGKTLGAWLNEHNLSMDEVFIASHDEVKYINPVTGKQESFSVFPGSDERPLRSSIELSRMRVCPESASYAPSTLQAATKYNHTLPNETRETHLHLQDTTRKHKFSIESPCSTSHKQMSKNWASFFALDIGRYAEFAPKLPPEKQQAFVRDVIHRYMDGLKF